MSRLKSPEEYPDWAWRPQQRKYCAMVQAIGAPGEPIRVGLEGPCGSGKSIGYLRAALSPGYPPCNVLSTTRQHLAQLEATLVEHFPGQSWACLRGRSWYDCCGKRDPDSDEDVEGREWTVKGDCPLGERCKYWLAVQQCARAQVVIQCTIGFLYRQAAWSQVEDPDDPRHKIIDRDVCILDEAHEYMGVRRSFETDEIPVRLGELTPTTRALLDAGRKTKGGYKRGYVLLSDGHEKRPFLKAMLEDFQEMLTERGLAKRRPMGKSEVQWQRLKDALRSKIQRRIDVLMVAVTACDLDPVLYLKFERSQNGVDILTLVQEPLFAGVGFKLAEREIFTSATIADCAPLLKIDRTWVHIFPEIFQWDTAVTPMALPDPDPTQRGNKAMSADVIEQLYRQADRPLTLALFLSRAHVKAAAAKIQGAENVFVQGVDGELSEIVDKVRAGDYDVLGAAPFILAFSGWVGVDLPGAKWLILGSATRSPLSPVHEARQIRKRGGGWHDGEKVISDTLRLKQGLGRALRSKDDRAVVIWTDTAVFQELGLSAKTGRVI